MKSFVTQKGDVQLRLENFSGLQAYAPQKGGAGAQALCNLRCMPDGTLRRRDGVRTLVKLPKTLRGAIWDKVNSLIYAVAGEHVYAVLQTDGGEYTWEMIGQLQSSEGAVDFFMLDNSYIMMDGVTMYSLTPSAAAPLTPYIPLYGKDWSSVSSTTVNEQRNALTDQVHIRYSSKERLYTLRLSVIVDHVDAIYRNGVLMDATAYKHYDGTGDISFTSGQDGGTVFDLIVSLPPDNEMQRLRNAFLSCRCAIRPGEVGRTVALFGGGNQKSVLYLSNDLSAEQKEACRAIVPGSTMLYLRPEGERALGDGTQSIYGMARHYDRTLIMTDKGTWTTDMQRLLGGSGTDTFLAVNSTLGCTAWGGAISVGNNPISIYGNDILHWNADTDELDECNAQSMTDKVRSLLPPSFGGKGRIYYDGKHDEIVLYLPGEDVPCLIRQRALQCWTMFDYGGRSVQGFFSVGEEMGVLLDDQVCLYDEALAGDADVFGSLLPISCCLVSHDLSFAHDGASVRPYASLVCAEAANGQKMTLSLRAAGGRIASVELLATGEVPCEMQKRISLGRCRHARLELRCDCLGAFTLHMICLAAGK